MEKTIICIGREYGSGGHEIGELLAKRTGYAFYDKEKLFEIAKMRGYEKEMQEYLDEQPVDSLLYSIAMNFAEPKEKRSAFRKDYTGQEWGMSKNYDLSVSTTELSYEQAVDLILYYKKMTEESDRA